MLSRLAERGSVVKSPGSGKSVLYSASERLFNIYYLMRRRSHPSSRVRALVSFMTDYYDRDELIDTATTLAREACSVRPDSRMDYHAFYDAILARTTTPVRTSILERTPPDFLTSFTAHQKAMAESARAHAEMPVAVAAIAESVGMDSAMLLEPVSVDVRTGLCPRAGIPAGKGFGEARDRGGTFGDTRRFQVAETTLSRVSGGKAAESQRIFRSRQETAIARDCVVGLVGLKLTTI
jgi:hypothetical protein